MKIEQVDQGWYAIGFMLFQMLVDCRYIKMINSSPSFHTQLAKDAFHAGVALVGTGPYFLVWNGGLLLFDEMLHYGGRTALASGLGARPYTFEPCHLIG